MARSTATEIGETLKQRPFLDRFEENLSGLRSRLIYSNERLEKLLDRCRVPPPNDGPPEKYEVARPTPSFYTENLEHLARDIMLQLDNLEGIINNLEEFA